MPDSATHSSDLMSVQSAYMWEDFRSALQSHAPYYGSSSYKYVFLYSA